MIYGQGIYNGGIIRSSDGVMDPAYMKWMAMLGRCYSTCQLVRDPCYLDVEVCEEWKTFSNFYGWLQIWKNWETLEIDKDIIGGRIYSPDTCLMISGDLNKFLAYRKKS